MCIHPHQIRGAAALARVTPNRAWTLDENLAFFGAKAQNGTGSGKLCLAPCVRGKPPQLAHQRGCSICELSTTLLTHDISVSSRLRADVAAHWKHKKDRSSRLGNSDCACFHILTNK
jgi:hypothetical protein